MCFKEKSEAAASALRLRLQNTQIRFLLDFSQNGAVVGRDRGIRGKLVTSLLQHPSGSTHPGPISSATLQSSWHLCGQARAWLFPHSPWTLTPVPDCRSPPARKAVSQSSTSHFQTHSSLNPSISCQLTRVKGPGDLGILITHGAAALVTLVVCVSQLTGMELSSLGDDTLEATESSSGPAQLFSPPPQRSRYPHIDLQFD